jgi:CheY-like chemotaxis protein
VQGIVYEIPSLGELSATLDKGSDDHEVSLGARAGVRDGQWLLVTFSVGGEATSVAARVTDRGSDLRLRFEERDWEKLLRFASGEGPVSAPPPPSFRPESVHAPPGASILMVDADASVPAIVGAMLDACGVRTAVAESAEEALDKLRAEPFDALVVEPVLSGMQGLDLCRRVRAEEGLAGIPILILSSGCRAAEVREAMLAGADDFLGKPFRAHELRCRVLGLLQRMRRSAE